MYDYAMSAVFVGNKYFLLYCLTCGERLVNSTGIASQDFELYFSRTRSVQYTLQ